MTNYLVCSTQRSGTTLLCSLLERTGLAGMAPDPIAQKERALLAIMDDPNRTPPAPVVEVNDEPGLRAFLALCFDESRTPNGVGGWKLMHSDVEQLKARVGAASADRVLELLPPDCRFVLVSRQDHVAQAVSMVRATNTQCWSSKDREHFRGWEYFDAHEARRRVQQIARYEANWRSLLAHYGDAVLEVTYEDLVRDRRAVVGRVMKHIGVEWTQGSPTLEDDHRRQADNRTSRFRARLERVSGLSRRRRRLDRIIRLPLELTARVLAARRRHQRLTREWSAPR